MGRMKYPPAPKVLSTYFVSSGFIYSIESSTYNYRHAMLMRYLGNGLNIRNVVPGIANALNIHSLGLVINSSSNILRLVAVDELGLDAQTRKEDLELVVRAAVEVGRGDDVVTGVGKSRDGDELGALARGGSQRRRAALQCCDALLENVDCGVHDAAVDVAELLEAEEPRAVSRVIEGEALSDGVSTNWFC